MPIGDQLFKTVREISIVDEPHITFEVGNSKPTAIHIVWRDLTGSATLDIQASNDRASWNSLMESSFDMTTDDNFLLIEPSTPYQYLRVFTNGATGGVYDVYLIQK